MNVHSFIVNFGLFKKTFDPSSAICSNVVIYAFYVSKWTIRARRFPWKFFDFVCSSGHWAEKSRSCDKKNFSRFVKTLFYLSRGSLLVKKFYTEKKIVLKIFSDIEQNCSSVILKNVWRSSENCLFFGVAFLWNKYFLKIYDFLLFFRSLEKTSVGVMKNMLFNCLGDQFWGKMLTRNSSNF